MMRRPKLGKHPNNDSVKAAQLRHSTANNLPLSGADIQRAGADAGGASAAGYGSGSEPNTAVYWGVPMEQNNQVSSLLNVARNIGGRIGISTVTTLTARRAH